jgi:hypothetical protein
LAVASPEQEALVRRPYGPAFHRGGSVSGEEIERERA